jgi:SPP1 family phage portal protein
MMSELECAELWYLVEDTGNYWTSIAKAIGIKKPKYQLKMKILSPALRDNLYPLYNEYGDMIAFARGYRTKEEGKEVEHFDVYTADFSYKYINRGSWALDKNAVGGGIIKNSTGKIPVIYHLQSKPEWSDVQGMIERLETLLSNHGDMNDYFGEPILAIFGQLIQAINKGESGKIMQLSENAKASFLALDSPPESIKMEVENLEKFIYAMSQTPNISFEQMKDIGQLSGIALTLMFLDAHMAAVAKEETFGSGVQRRVNLIKAYIGNVLNVGLKSAAESVFMKPVFTPYMPIDIEGLITTLSQATNAGYVSKETAAEKLEDAGYIESAEREYERLADQRKNESRVGLTFGEA